MNCHAVPPPDYKAGIDSKRDELCEWSIIIKLRATGDDWSIIKLRATVVKDPLNTGEVQASP